MIEASGLLPKLQAAVVASLPSYKTSLGVYYTVSSVTEMLDHGYSAPALTGKALLVAQNSKTVAAQDFRRLKVGFKNDGARRFDLGDPITQQILRSYQAAESQLISDGQPHIAVTGASPLGFVFDEENQFLVSMIASYQWKEGQESAPMIYAMSVGVLLLDADQIELTIAVPYQSVASIDSANSRMVEWMRDVQRANNARR